MMLAHNTRGGWWWYGSSGGTFPPVFHYTLLPCDRWQQRGSLTERCLTWKCIGRKRVELNSSTWKNIAPIGIHQCLLNVCEDLRVDVSTVREWVVRFSNNMKDKPHSCQPSTAVTPQNEECLDQLIHANREIMTRELCTELNIGFTVLETRVTTLEYCKVCARWVSWTLTGIERTPYASLLGPTEPWRDWRWKCPGLHYYQRRDMVILLWAGVKWHGVVTALHGVVTREFLIKENVQDAALSM